MPVKTNLIPALLWLAFCPLALLASTATERDYYGFWEVREPNGDICHIVVKRSGEASCFWSGTSFNQIDKGRWELTSGKLLITWENGHRYVLELVDKDNILRTSFPPELPLTAEPTNRIAGKRFDRRMVGSLARGVTDPGGSGSPRSDPLPADRPTGTTAPAPIRDPLFLGYWEVAGTTSLWGLMGQGGFFFALERDGSVKTSLKDWGSEHSGQIGNWETVLNEARLFWPSGHKAIVRKDSEDTFAFHLFNPNRDLSDKPSSTFVARKLPPARGRALFGAGETQMLAVDDIIGNWGSPDNVPAGPSRIVIERWGKARLYDSREIPLYGQWKLDKDSLHIVWEDESQDILSVGRQGLIRRFYKETTPLTAVPDREYPLRRLPDTALR